MLLVTMDNIPGYDIVTVLGPVAMTVPAIAPLQRLSAELVNDARKVAINQILQQAGMWNANAVVGVRFETAHSAIPLVTAYGTAVRVTPVSPDAVRQYDAMVAEGRMPSRP